ncbi:class I SAM-dependent methyltransferase [Candidatus Parcubacteria bacterium]|nr:class I SAM-dependent methyltransferase [Candidatus Parcubacteria bacterium]
MTTWVASNTFFEDRIQRIFTEKKRVVDIGGGLRILKKKGNRYDPKRAALIPSFGRVEYLVLDPIPDYEPDIVGDIHKLPFRDDSQPAIVCESVLEHVEDPIRAVKELHRVLEPGGYLYVYVPFLFYYHAEKTYYKDYWRFTKDAVELLFKDFSQVEIQRARGPIETVIHLSPLGRVRSMNRIARFFDRVLGKTKSNQVSGYSIFAIK